MHTDNVVKQPHSYLQSVASASIHTDKVVQQSLFIQTKWCSSFLSYGQGGAAASIHSDKVVLQPLRTDKVG